MATSSQTSLAQHPLSFHPAVHPEQGERAPACPLFLQVHLMAKEGSDVKEHRPAAT